MPISPERVFIACATPQAEAEFQRLNPLEVMLIMNDTVVRQAQSYVWGTDDAHLRFVKKRMGKK